MTENEQVSAAKGVTSQPYSYYDPEIKGETMSAENSLSTEKMDTRTRQGLPMAISLKSIKVMVQWYIKGI